MHNVQTAEIRTTNGRPKKIPPKPPVRKIFRSDPEGMQQTFSSELADQQLQLQPKPMPMRSQNVQQSFVDTSSQKYLLSATPGEQFVHSKTNMLSNKRNLSNSATLFNSNVHQLSPKQTFMPAIHHPNSSTNHQLFQQQFQLNHKVLHKQATAISCTNGRGGNVMKSIVENHAEKSDPENHIYEMIDEYKVTSNNFITSPATTTVNADPFVGDSNLFQNLLQTEMMNQMQACNNLGTSGYLSHLTHEKRMDIIQETALSLATATYLEK